jgi:hypothetical protein
MIHSEPFSSPCIHLQKSVRVSPFPPAVRGLLHRFATKTGEGLWPVTRNLFSPFFQPSDILYYTVQKFQRFQNIVSQGKM